MGFLFDNGWKSMYNLCYDNRRGGAPLLRKTLNHIILAFCAVLIVGAMAVPSNAQETAQAEDISGKKLVEKQKGFGSVHMLFDGRTKEPVKFREDSCLTLAHEGGIGSLYLIFDAPYGEYTITVPDTEQTFTAGTNDFLHEFLDLEAIFGTAPDRVQLTFAEGGKLNELSAFTPGQVPDQVQKWEPPAEGKTDIALFSTHGDDEQLFFAGLLPYYAAEQDCQVQVIYMTDHRNMTNRRAHEMLDGLWAVGVKTYPVFGKFGDYNSRSKVEAYQKYRQKGVVKQDILSFVVEQLRRFRPKVAVGHDLDGEYGHGMHMIYAELLCKAVEISADPQEYPKSAEAYGTWDVPKTYLHLYPENPIVMDWDQPLESFGGMTAYEVTKELGFPKHASQQSYYSWYFSGKAAAVDITQYSPREFGLYRSTVGADVAKNDFLENVTTYAQDAVLEQQRLEEEARREAEEAARLAAEAEKQRQAELAAQQTEPPAEPAPEKEEKLPGIVPYLGITALAALAAAAVLTLRRKKK